MNFESVIDQIVRKAQDEGAFDDLSTHGKPLRDLDRKRSAVDLWLERKVRDEGLELPLPDALQLRKDVPTELARIRSMRDETEVRRQLLALNGRIIKVNSRHISGPSSGIAAVDVDRFIAGWRRR